jgi:creatinine amidohydrolase
MMMAVRPELVAEERFALAKANRTPDVADIVGGGVYRWRAIGAMSSSGVVGNPEAASAAKGVRLFDAVSAVLADKLGNEELWTLPWEAERVE